ncbi:hypothetical protein OESDEN_13316 [Oesophagostomum dentatum]|uniref:Uncharacterized protein n=1 Tax=Oesophagostomum dentatum TaxID=61180 RepID=A0A0B1SUM5_OESDE|nr:hypothetical protein OESDEN_13316 [Oesophagostomum dentatum]
MGLAPTAPETHQLKAVAVVTKRARQSRMQSSPAFLCSMFALLVLAALIPSGTEAQEYRPIIMNRRDLVPYGEIVSELKGKTMGGRMRFGKRSMSPYLVNPVEAMDAYERQQQF